MAGESLREIVDRGVELTHGEAVAIAQQLITSVATDRQRLPPFSPPLLDNLHLCPDGSVDCLACSSTPPVSEIASLIDAMLPRGGTTRVPGALRYTIARALLEVDAPPFESLAALSAALSRHEPGERSVVLRSLYARAAATPAEVIAFHGERRRHAPSVAELRRQLRQADEALYRQAHSTTPRAGRATAGRWLFGGAVAVLIAFAAGYAIVDQIQTVTRRARTVSTLPSAPVVSSPQRRVAPPDKPPARAEDASVGRVVSRSGGAKRTRNARAQQRRPTRDNDSR